MTGARQVLFPVILRAQLLDDGGRVRDTAWCARVGDEPPVTITLDQDSTGLVQVTLSAVRNPRLATLLQEACPRGRERYGDAERGGPSVGLDPWIAEGDPAAVGRGYLWQHWSFPRLVIERTRRSDDPVAIVGEPLDVPESFATGLAIEHPERAGWHDLWWPREIAGTTIAPPVRTYQFVREASLPPVPV